MRTLRCENYLENMLSEEFNVFYWICSMYKRFIYQVYKKLCVILLLKNIFIFILRNKSTLEFLYEVLKLPLSSLMSHKPCYTNMCIKTYFGGLPFSFLKPLDGNFKNHSFMSPGFNLH